MRSVPALRGRAVMLAVPTSQIALAVSGYFVLVAAGRTTPAAVFAAVSAFYLLLNTVGRGVFAAVELELTRAVASARAGGDSGRGAIAGLAPRAAGLLVGALALMLLASPLLLAAVGDPWVVGLLLAGAVVMAASYFLRGPLAATGRYRAYSTTFFVEATVGLVGGVGLAVTGIADLRAWTALFVVGPLVACVLVGGVVLGPGLLTTVRGDLPASSVAPADRTVTTAGLLWAAALFLSSQGVWNLGAVIVVARTGDVPTVGAGYAAVGVLLRAPVLVFPAVQALVLPRASAAAGRGVRALDAPWKRWAPLGMTVAVTWVVVGLVVVPPLTRAVFGLTTLPALLVVGALAAAALVGAAGQFAQVQLVAEQRQRSVALAWLGGLVVLVVGAFLPLEPTLAGGLAQLTAVGVACAGMCVALRGRRAGA